jgi:hypothetical protein
MRRRDEIVFWLGLVVFELCLCGIAAITVWMLTAPDTPAAPVVPVATSTAGCAL